ncbi:uncharacterized protein LOC112906007, partial [Agrilus planipennis]|uniref:Uncharacterized protein LOC112906007 n=1 Tax=Agrilus planipennis TaxID=224129 RepID=A0A7F5RH43_AGRPL
MVKRKALTHPTMTEDDRKSTRKPLDTGTDICVYPKSLIPGPRQKSTFTLQAANGTNIVTYGTIVLSLNLDLRRYFPWRFIIADVTKPIIGADFLAHYQLLVDLSNQRLLDRLTHLTTSGQLINCSQPSVTFVTETKPTTSAYHEILQHFPSLTRPRGQITLSKHSTRHYINTTPGPPVA